MPKLLSGSKVSFTLHYFTFQESYFDEHVLELTENSERYTDSTILTEKNTENADTATVGGATVESLEAQQQRYDETFHTDSTEQPGGPKSGYSKPK